MNTYVGIGGDFLNYERSYYFHAKIQISVTLLMTILKLE